MAPTEPWQTRQKEGERGKERIGEKPMVNKRNTTEVESVGLEGLGQSPTCGGVSPPLSWRGKIQDFAVNE